MADRSRDHFAEFRQCCNQAADWVGGRLGEVEGVMKRELEAIRPKAERAAPHFRRAAGNIREAWRAFWEAEDNPSNPTESKKR